MQLQLQLFSESVKKRRKTRLNVAKGLDSIAT